MTSERKKANPLNDEVRKGIMIDGFDVFASLGMVVLDGVMYGPRADEPTVVSRVMFPVVAIDPLIELFKTIKEQLKTTKTEVIKGKISV